MCHQHGSTISGWRKKEEKGRKRKKEEKGRKRKERRKEKGISFVALSLCRINLANEKTASLSLTSLSLSRSHFLFQTVTSKEGFGDGEAVGRNFLKEETVC